MNAIGYGVFFNCLQSVYKMLCGQDVEYIDSLNNVSTTISATIASIATTLAIILVYMALAKQSAIVVEHHPESIFKFLFRSALVFVLINNSSELFGETLISALNALAKSVFTSMGLDGSKASFADYINLYSVSEVAKNLLSKIISLTNPTDWFAPLLSFIFSIMLIITGVQLMISCFTRFFKIYMFTCFLPLGIAYFAEPSFSQYGKNYARAYLGACLEGVTIAIAIMMFLAFSKAYNDTTFTLIKQLFGGETRTTQYIFRIAILSTFTSITKNADTITNKLFGFM